MVFESAADAVRDFSRCTTTAASSLVLFSFLSR